MPRSALATDNLFSDVALGVDPEPTITYRSGLVTYQESLTRGQFVGRGWNGSGYTNPESLRLNPARHATPQAFWVEIDGQLLHSHLEWGGYRREATPRGLHAVVDLRHAIRPVTLRVHTLLDGTPVLTRWLEITNTSDHPAALAAAFPWSGVLQETDYAVDEGTSPYSVGYFVDAHALGEGRFDWRPLPHAGYRIDGRYRHGRHRHPFFVLRNGRTGETWVANLAWSGGFAFEFDLDEGPDHSRARSSLFFRAGPDGPPPLRVLAPGETVATPEMHMGLVIGDLDEATQAMHDHLRRSVLFPEPEERRSLVISGIGPEQEITPERFYHDLEISADLGAEVFFIDASWYARPHSHWWKTVGNWAVDRERFPDGLAPLREKVHAKGLLFGLWMEAERLGSESQMAQDHPDWFAVRYDGQPEPSGLIDLTNPEVAQWLEEQISRVITENKLDFYKLDYNIGFIGGGDQTVRAGFVENAYWRYYEALYGIYSRLRAKFPQVIFENCASGGGRTDVGLMPYFNHTWISDWQIAPRAFAIVNGMTLALPPERVVGFGGMGLGTHVAGELDFQCRLWLFTDPTYAWPQLGGLEPNTANMERVRHAIEIYKRFVRPYSATSRLYHHTPVVKGHNPHGWGALELASRDRTRAMVGAFRLSDPAEDEYLLRVRGLDMGRRYRVTLDNSGDAVELDGYLLGSAGLPLRLEAPLTSELLLIEALEERQTAGG